MSAGETPEGWDALRSAIASARAELMAAAPDANSAAEVDAYLMRVMTQNLDDAFLKHLFIERGLSRALPTTGGPNPHYIIYHAGIDDTRRYRLQGRMNDSERVGVGLYSFTPAGAVLLAGYAALDRLTVNSDGGFTLDIAADAEGHGTLAIKPGTRVLIVRVLHRSPQGQPCALSLEGRNVASDLLPAGGSSERALAQAGHATLRAIRQFLRWSQLTSANPNRFTPPPAVIAEEAQGDPDTTYFFGYYDLRDGEYLEALLPEAIKGYWSLHAYNHWCEVLPNAGVDDLAAVTDDDGCIRVRIGPMLSLALTNRIDTLGRYRGVLIFRIIGGAATKIPQAEVRRC